MAGNRVRLEVYVYFIMGNEEVKDIFTFSV